MQSELLSEQDIQFDISLSSAGTATSGQEYFSAASAIVQGYAEPTTERQQWYELRIHGSDLVNLGEIFYDTLGDRDVLLRTWDARDSFRGEDDPHVGFKAGFPCGFDIVDKIIVRGTTCYMLAVASPWPFEQLAVSAEGRSPGRLLFRPTVRDEAIVFEDDLLYTNRVTVSIAASARSDEEATLLDSEELCAPHAVQTPGTQADSNIEQALDVAGDVSLQIRQAFRSAEEEEFEDGIESAFSKTLTALIMTHGNFAADIMIDLILSRASPHVAAEAIGCLGRIEHAETHQRRMELLHKSLRSTSIIVRDAAMLGVGDIADPESISALEQAMKAETCVELKRDMEETVIALKESLLR